ncbi:MAG TPA: LysR family transcriptional regulator [Oceanicaulis sp.]|uniref:LysR family transcriptional regulator n=1 Tax=Glycocaulis albus TaxID=1382801 RepID=A0ABQ1XXF1_9PROT|nr:LysR substrate-binding domain-containing protein [Glycocaulis albus]MBV5257478.1 LysR family transcriptional regulator [Synechococcus moorigangaii CMS01]GGH06225.1 LysR family transcriptional regulator [Glycocaulis albus]HCY54041.1 LysR family transcriptional regulator [Oceanicaulis sp.]
MSGTINLPDLNELYLFAQVVEHGGFAAAGRAIAVPKSRLSRKLAQLEERLGVTLIHRSTRHFSVTDAGQLFYRHCAAMIAQAQAAEEAMAATRSEPQGTIRVSCPVLVVEKVLAPMIADFMTRYPKVRVRLESTNRRVDVIEEGFDMAIRVRPPPLEDSGLILRQLGTHRGALVASPDLIARFGRPETPEDLSRFESLSQTSRTGEHVITLTGPDGQVHRISHDPRLVTDDLEALRQAVIAGGGVAALPRLLVCDDIEAGRLVPLLPDYEPPGGLAHVVFPSRRGLIPAVRLFIDALPGAFRDHVN